MLLTSTMVPPQPPPIPDHPASPPRMSTQVRPSTSGGGSTAPMAFRRPGHSPSPSISSALGTSPSSTSIQSLVQTPSSLSLSGLKSRLSTKKGKRSFTSIGTINPNASISPPTIATAPPLPRNAAPRLRAQKSVDSLMLARNGSRESQVPGLPSSGFQSSGLNNSTTLMGPPSGGTVITPIPTMYETIHDTAEKRINTLDYLRRAHEGRIYWYNTIKFTKQDLATRVHTNPKQLARRATNYFVLGQSVPSILEIGATNPLDYLKAFNQLLAEYEAFIAIHPADGTTGSSGSRVSRVKLWSRSSQSKPRRGSSATQGGIDGLYHFTSMDTIDRQRSSSSALSSHLHYHAPIPPPLLHSSSSNSDDFMNDEYSFLINPHLPFEPDYYETFSSLCDVLIDAYSRVLSLINAPENCGIGMGEAFLKADAKIKKLIISNVAKEFEDASRAGVRNELAGLARSVLGGMI